MFKFKQFSLWVDNIILLENISKATGLLLYYMDLLDIIPIKR